MDNLTRSERRVLDHLTEAWNAYLELEDKDHCDNIEFRSAVHAAQALIAVRVARRVDPKVWKAPQ